MLMQLECGLDHRSDLVYRNIPLAPGTGKFSVRPLPPRAGKTRLQQDLRFLQRK